MQLRMYCLIFSPIRYIYCRSEGYQEEAGQDSISVTDKSVAEVVFILLDRYDRNLTKVTDSRQCQPC